jgi:hypothetical protein
MKERGLDLQDAVDCAGKLFGEVMEGFATDKARLPSWGTIIDANVAAYVEAMGHWVIGNLEWSFETQRYFGCDHTEIKTTRLVTMRPAACGGQMDDSDDSDLE